MRPLTFHVLKLLCEEEFRSGQALAHRLNVSRASVWGALNEAQSAGMRIHRVHGRGYRLAERLDWLDADKISRTVADLGLVIEICECCESTNATLIAMAEAGAQSGRVVAAELQTLGRGRLGRAWQSGLANALTFSLLWRFEKGIAGLGGLSLAVGVAVARVFRREGVQVELKWPNDLFWHARKLGGVLIEVRGDALGPCAAVIGVGLNVRLSPSERSRIDQPAADLVDVGAPALTRSEWLGKFLVELATTLGVFAERGFEHLCAEWSQYSAHQDKAVCLSLPDGTKVAGIARGVDEQGRLLIDRDGLIRAYLSADVSLRAAHDSGN
jgi:BirA family biotin operon repressor/biotin-[acetyl-CoA-carboxylase] ligase